jgi:hypothetical protein
MTFQWKFNGTDITGATGDSLVLSGVGQSNAGQYAVVLSNSAGSVASNNAELLLDSDGDGLPDAWETANFTDPDPTHPLNPANQRSETDPDHDGISNLDEFLESTDPKTDTSQKPRLTVYSDAGGAVAVTPIMKLSYDLNETVTLTATAFAPSEFIGWSGDLSGMTNPVQLALTERQTGVANRTIRARFAIAVPPPPGLIALWRGETDASDSIGGHDGRFFAGNSAVVAPTVTASGKVGGAFSFDGTAHVRVPTSEALKPPEFTIEAWVFPSALRAERQTVFAHGSSVSSDPAWRLALTTDSPGFVTFPPSSVLGLIKPITSNQWTHMAISFDGTTMRIYINGAQVAWRGGLGPIVYDSAGAPLTIGSNWAAGASTERFTGLIDEVSLYNRALTPTEVADIYNADRLGKDVTRP